MPKKTFFNLLPDKKQRIIDAVYDLFIEEDYEKVNIRAIAKKAGISIGSFYEYFYDKDELYLYLMTTIGKKVYAKEKEKKGKILFIKDHIPLEEVCTEKEIKFNRTWQKVPVEVMRKFYFGKYNKELNNFLLYEFLEIKASGKLKDSLNFDLIYYLYTTLMFNMSMYFREKNITDPDERYAIKSEYFTDLFLTGILKDPSSITFKPTDSTNK